MIKLTELFKSINEAEKAKAKAKPAAAKPAPKAAAAPAQAPVAPAPVAKEPPLSSFDKNLAAFTKERPAPQAEPLPATQSDHGFLNQVKQGLSKADKFMSQEPAATTAPVAPLPPAPPASPTNVPGGDPVTALDPDALKAFQKGLSKVDSPAAQSADRITNKMYKRPEKQEVEPSDKPIPSLAQLAKDAGEEEEPKPEDTEDPALAGLPKFDDTEPEENPFGDPHAGQPDDFRTGTQKGLDAFKKGAKAAGQAAKKGAQVAGQGIKKNISKGAAAIASRLTKPAEPDAVPSNWQQPSAPASAAPSEEEPEAGEDGPMPSVASVAKSTDKPAEKSKNGLAGKHYQWKPGQQVDIGFVKDLTVLKVDQYGAQLKGKNGGVYRFVPHRGLRKISN
jgi:hypothetical protein